MQIVGMRTACIVQARLASTRLPAKILLPLPNGRSVLEEVLYRCRLIKGIDVLVAAIADDDASDIVAKSIAWMTDKCFGDQAVKIIRGPEQDVLTRYLKAAEEVQAEIIMRVTSDCPLIDPRVCEQVLEARAEFQGYDYACNNQPPTYPHGLDCEAFTIEALRKADMFEKPELREHVTEWMRTASEIKRYNLAQNGADQHAIRLTLDTVEDYLAIRKEFDKRLADGSAL
jgi:spore coat polysaccharide biosynthesis protein SpsF (cytidylyltransferase family)